METGRLTFVHAGDGQRLAAVEKQGEFPGDCRSVRVATRTAGPHGGNHQPVWVDGDEVGTDDGVFAFARGGNDGTDAVIVVLNASDRERATGLPGNAIKLVSSDGKPLLAEGDKLVRVPISALDTAGASSIVPEVRWRDGMPQTEFRVGPGSVNIFRRVR